MLVRQYLAFIRTAGAAGRAEAGAALARAFLAAGTPGGLPGEETAEAELALTAMLDDDSPQVRRALAQELASSPHAPRHIVSALAADQSDVSACILNRSPLLGPAELIDCARIGDAYAQAAIALRPGLPREVCSALAASGCCEALVALAVNETAGLDEAAMYAMLSRFGADGELREALLARAVLPAGVRCALLKEAASALESFVSACGWMAPERAARAARESREAGVIEIAAEASLQSEGAAAAIVSYLRGEGLLTPAALLRALLSGNRSLLVAALADLSAMPAERAAGLTRAWSGPGFAAIYEKAGMPALLLPAFRAALSAQDEYGLVYAPGQRPRLSHLLNSRTLQTLNSLQIPDFSSVTGMLQRLASEAAREEARRMTESMMQDDLQVGAPPVVETARPVNSQPLEIDLEALKAEILAAA